MTLAEAIDLLKDELTREVFYYGPGRKDALKLGIEALKRELHNRRIFPDVEVSRLPGETKD